MRIERRRDPLVEKGIERFAGSVTRLDRNPAGRFEAGGGLEVEDAGERGVQVFGNGAIELGNGAPKLASRRLGIAD